MSGPDPLAELLGGELPPGLDALSPEQRQHLAAAIEGARARQSRELAAAAEASLGFLPKLLRRAVRKVVFG